ncbi:MAG TPA: hypothetical protein VGF86_09000 [Candidatus Tumulicola sp.]|jgi:hypothetical protein
MSDRVTNGRSDEFAETLEDIPANEGGRDVPPPIARTRAGNLSASIRFGTAKGDEATVDLQMNAEGFRDARPGEIANVLLQHFDRTELEQVLSHLSELRSYLSK